jgi:thiol-disulfide isomerase/thioredoxin
MHYIVLLALLSFSCIPSVAAQEVPAIKSASLMERMEKGGDTTYLINFWATWCAPCVRELPQFEAVNQKYGSERIKVILVSLDLKRDYDIKLPAFIKKRNLKSEVVFLDESDANSWIPLIHPEWSGVIPATWAYNKTRNLNLFEWSEWEEGSLEKWLIEKVLP